MCLQLVSRCSKLLAPTHQSLQEPSSKTTMTLKVVIHRTSPVLYCWAMEPPWYVDQSMASRRSTALTLCLKASNRLSHWFDLRGPSMSVDTGCSTTMTAFHQACASLHMGESDMSIIGGANVILNPDNFLIMSSVK